MSDPLRVVMVTTSYPRTRGDFAGHFVESLARAIVELGNEVTVIAPHDPGVPSSEESEGVSVRRVRYSSERAEKLAYGDGIASNIKQHPWTLLAVPGLAHVLRRNLADHAMGADVVHAHWAPTAALARADRCGVPYVVSLHGSDLALAQRGGVWRSLLRRGVAGAAAVHVVAAAQRDTLLETGLYDGPVEIIPSGVPLELTQRVRAARDEQAPLRILFVGRLVEGKGVADLIAAFADAAPALPGARLVIVGTGPAHGDLAAAAAAREVADSVDFLGELAHEAALEEMERADLLVLPSYAEGSPLSVTEALALGTPVLGTSLGAMPQLVGDGGLLVEPGDVGGLAGALTRLAQDPSERIAMGERARSRMERDYGWPGIARRTVELYRTAIAGPQPGR